MDLLFQSGEWKFANGWWRRRVSTNGAEVEYICQWLVVAIGKNVERLVPEIERFNEFGGEVIHVCEYKSGESFEGKKVLVGCGNSGMEVSLDLCNHDAKPSMVVRSSVSSRTLKEKPLLAHVSFIGTFGFYKCQEPQAEEAWKSQSKAATIK